MVLQGKAGSGKSTIIQSIVKKITEQLGNDAVKVVAPTGAAAVNINGQTVHSAFKLETFRKYKLNMQLNKIKT